MNWPRRFLVLGFAVALALGVGCSASDTLVAPAAPGTSIGPSEDGVGDDERDDEGENEDDDGDEGDDVDEGDDEADDDGEAEGEGEDDGKGENGRPEGIRGLACTRQPYIVTNKVIGRSGGSLIVGNHALVIPPGALSEDVTITAQQIPGPVNSVRFRPEGLHFEEPATLTMSYGNCALTVLPKRIVYTDELLKILYLLQSTDLVQSQTVTSPIDHFSRYAVAY